MEKKPKVTVYFQDIELAVMSHASVEVGPDTHPELEGMTEDEMIEYIKENIYEMSAFRTEDYDSLGDEIEDSEIVREKYVNQDSKIVVEKSNEE
jgi:hypothetical protein